MSTIQSFSVKGALVSMSAVTVNESEDVVFECTVDSNPSSNIEIHYKDKVIFRQNDIHTLLYIRDNIACLDAGEYTCAARNPHNKGLDSLRHLMVNVRCKYANFKIVFIDLYITVYNLITALKIALF
jgi:hypothetical protein